jgi:hypothetical protein
MSARVGFRAAVGVALLLVLGSRAFAQVPAGLAGTVKDISGGVMPGVTVEAASPALIEKVRTAVTDADGQYKITALVPGVYSVTFTLTGFAPVKVEGVELTSGITGTVHAELKVGTLAETVTVTGQAALVDVQNVVSTKVMPAEMLQSLPTNKGIAAFAALTPGISVGLGSQDVGGNKGELATMSIHGGSGNDQRLLQDGMRFNSMEGSGRGFYVNPAAAQEVTLALGGNTADNELGGVQVNVVPKEGGNRFTGYYFTNYTTHRLQGDNLSQANKDRGLKEVPTVNHIWDVNAAYGGPIKKDKLWFYTAHRSFGYSNFIAAGQNASGGALGYFNKTQGTYPGLTPAGTPFPTGVTFYTPDLDRRSVVDEVNRTHTLRSTWQASQRDKFVFSVDVENNCDCHVGVSTASDPASVIRWSFANPNYLTQAIWNHPISNKLLLNAGVTTLIFNFPTLPQEGVGPHDIATNDQTLGINYNSLGVNTYSYGYHHSSQSNQKVDLSYITGSHNFKIGLFTMEGVRDQANAVNTVVLNGIEYPVTYRFANKIPNRITEAIPYRSIEKMKIDLGIYGSDQWTLKRLTLNLALRYDHLNDYVPALTQPANVYIGARALPEVKCLPCWTDWSPRLGAAYDLTGNGKTSLKMSFGKYVAAQSPNAIARSNAPVVTSVLTTNRVWTDELGKVNPSNGVVGNGNYIPDCDLSNNAANGECGVVDNLNFGQGIITSATSDPAILTSNRGVQWQSSVVVQRELMQRVSVNFGYYRTVTSNRSATVNDNTLTTPGDYSPYSVVAPLDPALPHGGGYTIDGNWDLNPNKQGQSQINTVFLNSLNLKPCPTGAGTIITAPCGEPRSTVYDGFDVTTTARFKNGAFLSGGTTTGRTNTNTCQVIDNPSVLRNCDRPNPFQTQLKLSGAYPLPWDFQFSGTFQNLPGNAISANYAFTNSQINWLANTGRTSLTGTTNVSINLLDPNTLFEKRLNQLDLRLSRKFRFGPRVFEAIVDAYNVFNSDTILGETSTYTPGAANGGNWRLPSEILAARFVKFGIQATF